MPSYEYATDDGEVSVILHRPVEERDAPVVLKRRTVPSRLTVGTGAKPETMGSKLRKGYYKLEERGQLKDRPNYLPAKTIKKALHIPDVH